MPSFNVKDLPAMKPPPGEVPNFAHPPNENAMTLAVISVCFAVAAIAVLLRCYSKLVTMRQLHLPDYLLLAAFAFYAAICVIYIRLAGNPGWFVHMWHLRMKDMIEFLRVRRTPRLGAASVPRTKIDCVRPDWNHHDVPAVEFDDAHQSGHSGGMGPRLPP